MEEQKRRRGGGPKTPEGKAVVRRNALKHGVLAQTPVLPQVESQEEWERLRQDVLDWFELERPLQTPLDNMTNVQYAPIHSPAAPRSSSEAGDSPLPLR